VLECDAEDRAIVVKTHFDVNRQCGTLAQAMSKRRKLVCDMAANLNDELTYELFAAWQPWASLQLVVPDATSHAKERLATLLADVSSWDVSKFNDGEELGRAVSLAVQAHAMVAGWPVGLELVCTHAHPMLTDAAADPDARDDDNVLTICQRMSTLPKLAFEGGTPLQHRGVSVLGLVMTPAPVGIGPSHCIALELKKQGIGDAGAADLCAAIRVGAFPSLKDLLLDANGLGVYAAEALSDVMASGWLCNLEKLWINDNRQLTDEGCKLLFASRALKASPALSELCANGVCLSSTSVHALAAAIEEGALPKLTRLNLINNEIDDGGCAKLAHALGRSVARHSLSRLQLENNVLSDPGLMAIVAELSAGRLPSLQTLEMHGNKKMSDEAKAEAAKAAVDAKMDKFMVGMVKPFMVEPFASYIAGKNKE